ncbi:AraC family transcriptional regulator [Pseudomonas cavernicola]|uniref:AraC family transcriptional regulator n=1 Tax=Pseudomonas cavernicola TaxID=2320866 RepID=A0A418XF12_9PSED|nr:AraC family transcriptional regulator [Pseudomonas cavernicola]RJG11079.1 AraC family transcriptional regulator [Pseudomonas cavernicola]
MTKNDQPVLANAFYTPTILPAIEELLARGIALERIEGELRRSTFELRTPFSRAPLFLSRRFWALALETSGDPMLGLLAGRRFTSTLTNGLTYLFDAAGTLESACGYFCEHFPFFNGHLRAEVLHAGGSIQLRLVEPGTLRSGVQSADYTLIGICGLIRRKFIASGVEHDPIFAVSLPQAQPADCRPYTEVLHVPVHWGQPCLAVHLDPALFSLPLTAGNQVLEETLVTLLEQSRAHSQRSLLDEVADYICSHLAQGPALSDFCSTQHLIERTAARRLKALGWSFSEMLDEYRRYYAEDLLAEQQLGLAEISDRLGYGDVQSFARACQRWFGCAPGNYRERLLLVGSCRSSVECARLGDAPYR